MALRDQPYLPLYVQDFMTDEKLAECSAQATGVYIRIMCLMHISNQAQEHIQSFVVHTANVDRAMMIINHLIKVKQDENEAQAHKNKVEYKRQEITVMIETAKILPVVAFIPMDFSTAYND